MIARDVGGGAKELINNVTSARSKPNQICTAPCESRNDTDLTHLELQSRTGARPAIQEQTHPNLYLLVGDDRRFSNPAVQVRVGLGLADNKSPAIV